MQTVECAIFNLNTCDIDSANVGDVYNQYGSTNALKNDTTWNNVSLKTILGDMYEKYDSFNVKFSGLMYQAIAAPSPTANEKQLRINIAGLPFNNCTYNTSMNCNTNVYCPAAFILGTAATNANYTDLVFTIEKPPAICNIRIYLTTMSNTVPNWVTPGPQMDFSFRIYGIKKQLC
jgi:hypothetical protein